MILLYFTGGLFDKWMDGQLPIPEWTPLILPDEILCEELSPTSPTPTEDGGGGVAGPGNFFDFNNSLNACLCIYN